MGLNARLRLYHEVTVTETGQQDFRYLSCHDRTGILRARPP
jgi:aldoxime dehydratase